MVLILDLASSRRNLAGPKVRRMVQKGIHKLFHDESDFWSANEGLVVYVDFIDVFLSSCKDSMGFSL